MISKRAFGRTGHDSSRVIFGAAALLRHAWGQRWAETVLDNVLAAGVNHIDTAASYGDSESMLGPWLAKQSGGVTNRSRVFLATKTGERAGGAARSELETSLDRLGVEQVDLIQLHNLVEEEDWQEAHRSGGVLEAMVAAREEGLVRFIGVTGHGMRIAGMHARSLEAFEYDSVLFPYNTTLLDDPAYRYDVEALLGMCAERSVAVQTIKSIARRRWPVGEPHDVDEQRSWYQPLREADAIERAMRVVLANGQLFLNTSSDALLMTEMLTAAARILADDSITAANEAELRHDIERLAITPIFDGNELERI